MTPPTYHLWTIGCQMNEADALRAASLLESAGFRPVPHAREAGLLLLNTCVVRQQAEDKIYSRLTYVAELKQKHPALVVALMGCLVGKNPRELARFRDRFPFIDLFLPSVLGPKAGDIVIFKWPVDGKTDYIKRCVAVAGQTGEFRGRRLFVDGVESVVGHVLRLRKPGRRPKLPERQN